MTDESPTTPVEILGTTTKIVMLAMAIVMVTIVISSFIVVLNERATQQNADRQEQINMALQAEFQCLSGPSFESDRALAELSIVIARGLAALAAGDGDQLSSLADQLANRANELESRLNIREESLTTCRQPVD